MKKVTGVFINGGKTRVANHKHYEFHMQYKYLKKHIVDIKTIEQYFKIYLLSSSSIIIISLSFLCITYIFNKITSILVNPLMWEN